jgi:D-hexose-6-phosphate mutarotase
LLLRDGSRKLTLSSEAFEDLVVWNPGPELCAGILDMPDDDWMQMLCVESAQIMQAPTLQAGESWTGRQSLILSTKTTERQAQVHASRHQQRLDVGQQFVGARAVTHK